MPINNPEGPIAPENPAISELSVVKQGDPIGYVRSVHRRSRQNLSEPTGISPAEDQTKPLEKKAKPVAIFTEIPAELEDTFLRIMFLAGLRNADLFMVREGRDPVPVPGAQSRKNKIRTIVEEIKNSRGDSRKIMELYTRAVSEIHPSTNPEARQQEHKLRPQQVDVVLKDPIGFIAVDILRYAKKMGIPVPPMKYRIVERLTHLRDEYDVAVASPKKRPLVGPGESQK